jgi:integrase
MIILALKAGLRQGELLALRREDIDLVTGLLRVRRSVTRGFVTEPKSGKGRDIPLGDEAIAALKAERHLRGPLVFCDDAGRMWKKNEVKHPLWRACRKAASVRSAGTSFGTRSLRTSCCVGPRKVVQERWGTPRSR